jgi:hypothetical protein
MKQSLMVHSSIINHPIKSMRSTNNTLDVNNGNNGSHEKKKGYNNKKNFFQKKGIEFVSGIKC